LRLNILRLHKCVYINKYIYFKEKEREEKKEKAGKIKSANNAKQINFLSLSFGEYSAKNEGKDERKII